MMEKTIALSQRVSYEPGVFTEFLWWLSTAEKELLADAVVDRNRHKIIGMTVLATWAFASLAWTYFFSSTLSILSATVWSAGTNCIPRSKSNETEAKKNIVQVIKDVAGTCGPILLRVACAGGLW